MYQTIFVPLGLHFTLERKWIVATKLIWRANSYHYMCLLTCMTVWLARYGIPHLTGRITNQGVCGKWTFTGRNSTRIAWCNPCAFLSVLTIWRTGHRFEKLPCPPQPLLGMQSGSSTARPINEVSTGERNDPETLEARGLPALCRLP